MISTNENIETKHFDADEGNSVPIPPPKAYKSNVKKPIKLIFDIGYLIIMLLPIVIWSCLSHIFTRRKSITGKVVVVTGAGRGLGRGFVEEFARLGCRVACVDLDERLNKETVEHISQMYPDCNVKDYICNVSLTKEIQAMKEAVIRDFGKVDILVNNAGIMSGSNFIEIDDALLHTVTAVNLTSHFLMIREFLPGMIEKNDGHIVAIGSIASLMPLPNSALYAATKHGIVGLMDTLHTELSDNPNNAIKTTIICPYFINTSALYVDYWKLRLPELSIKETVKVSVNGILKNRSMVIVPSSFYFFAVFSKFLPEQYQNLLRKIFYTRISMPPKQELEKFPLYQHLSESAKNFDLTDQSAKETCSEVL